jgi:hypothetical protein
VITRRQGSQGGGGGRGGPGAAGGGGGGQRGAGLAQNRPVLPAGSKVDRPGVKGSLLLLIGSSTAMTPQEPIRCRQTAQRRAIWVLPSPLWETKTAAKTPSTARGPCQQAQAACTYCRTYCYNINTLEKDV